MRKASSSNSLRTVISRQCLSERRTGEKTPSQSTEHQYWWSIFFRVLIETHTYQPSYNMSEIGKPQQFKIQFEEEKLDRLEVSWISYSTASSFWASLTSLVPSPLSFVLAEKADWRMATRLANRTTRRSWRLGIWNSSEEIEGKWVQLLGSRLTDRILTRSFFTFYSGEQLERRQPNRLWWETRWAQNWSQEVVERSWR